MRNDQNSNRRSLILLSVLLVVVVGFIGVLFVSFFKDSSADVNNTDNSPSVSQNDQFNEDNILDQLQGQTGGSLPRSYTTLPSFAELVDKVSPAVVKIETLVKVSKSGNSQTSPYSTVPDGFWDYFGLPNPNNNIPNNSTPNDENSDNSNITPYGAGSGFIISSDGYIVTNHHVIDSVEKIEVTLSNGKKYTAKLVGSDAQADIAVLKIEAQNLQVLQLGNSSELKQGDWVLAIGNPYGYDHTITTGIISALERDVVDESSNTVVSMGGLIQTDAAINQGNSGGPLLNLDGQVIGINTAIIPYAQGIGFAIAIDTAKSVINDIIKYGKYNRPLLGISYYTDSNIEEYLKANNVNISTNDLAGRLVVDVVPNGAADKAGIKQYDLIKEINGQTVDESTNITQIILKHKIGDTITLKVLRNGQPIELKATLQAAQ